MIGTKLAHYKITSHLGSGGMGDVYQATDSRLGRSVAIKFLPEAFSHDSERVARFEREARVLASLNHPHIAGIYGLEESGERKFLVMELVDGETLAEWIERGPIPVEESLGIAKQICEALEAAHEKGIIHRDLKPANVKITPEGKVKVLDFGLAKAFEAEASKANLSQSPTLSMAATNAGVILGTAAYMSPEQAKGRTVDKRTDIFAFGAVLYEMLTGRQAFEGEDIADILSRVLQREPDWTLLPANVPRRIGELLRRCLEKNVKNRRSDATDVRFDIEQALSEPPETAAVPAGSGTRERLWMSVAIVFLIVIAALTVPAVRYLREAAPASPPEMRLEITTPPTNDPASLAISPDGQKIVFAATSGGSRLWVRSLDSASARQLAGTDNASFPFWSPDSRSIGFFADGKMKRIDIDGGSLQVLANAVAPHSGTWNRDGVILFAFGAIKPIFSISATGGASTAVTRLQASQLRSHGFPQFLPDGRHFLYHVSGSPEARGVYIGQLDGPETRRLLDADNAAAVYASGQLLFVRQGMLFAQHFDPDRLTLTGNPFPVGDTGGVPANVTVVSASAAGPVVYRPISGGERQFFWIDRSGKDVGKVGNSDGANPLDPTLSPDGRHVALSRNVNGISNIWLLDLSRSVLSRFTFDAFSTMRPMWSPDGSRIVFQSNKNGVNDLYQKSASGAGTEELLLATPQGKMPTDWSRDGRFLLYRSDDSKTGLDLWALPLDGDRKPFPVVQTDFDERDGQFSPDGKWVAYQSNESGRFEIYVQSFPGPGGKTQISTDGGAQVRWRHDSKELFYIGLDDRLIAVPIRFASNGQSIEPDSPVPLFSTHIGGAVLTINRQQYAISADGQRFLMNTISDETTSPITVILNWTPPAK